MLKDYVYLVYYKMWYKVDVIQILLSNNLCMTEKDFTLLSSIVIIIAIPVNIERNCWSEYLPRNYRLVTFVSHYGYYARGNRLYTTPYSAWEALLVVIHIYRPIVCLFYSLTTLWRASMSWFIVNENNSTQLNSHLKEPSLFMEGGGA